MRKQHGQSLIELIVSIEIITTALSAVVALFPFIIEKNSKIQIQNKATLLAQSEIERLRGLPYYDKELDAFGTLEGMTTIKEEGGFLIRVNVKYIEAKNNKAPENYPLDLSEDTGLKEIKVSVKRKDNYGSQVDLITYFSKARPGKG